MAEEIKNLTSVVSNIEEEFELSNDIVPENVGYFSIDKRELRIGDGLTRWKDIVPFCYNEVAIDIIDDWEDREIDNIPSSVTIHNRFVPLEESDAINTAHVNSLLSRVTNLENTRAVNNHASTKNTFGLGTSTKYGHLMVSDSVTSTSDISKGVAATPKAVKSAYDLANTANNTANAAIPKAGGTFTGAVNNNSSYTTSSTNSWYNTKRTTITKGTAPNATTWTLGYRFLDKNNVPFGGVEHGYKTTRENRINLIAYSGFTTDTSDNAQIAVGYDSSGNPFTYAPTPSSGDNSNNIATTAFVNMHVKNNSIPIGTIIMYWGNIAPEGYLICDGRAISTNYPRLREICGNNTPNLVNYFIRGAGNGRTTGTTEDWACVNLTGHWPEDSNCSNIGGVFYRGGGAGKQSASGTGGAVLIHMDASRQWGSNHIASEFRPVNKAVLFCIKHD